MVTWKTTRIEQDILDELDLSNQQPNLIGRGVGKNFWRVCSICGEQITDPLDGAYGRCPACNKNTKIVGVTNSRKFFTKQ